MAGNFANVSGNNLTEIGFQVSCHFVVVVIVGGSGVLLLPLLTLHSALTEA